MATYNRSRILRDTLDGIAALSFPPGRWELLVVDNNSSDGTKSVCRRYGNELPLRYLFEPRQGKSFAVNAGLDAAAGELVVITDDDISPEPNWLQNLLAGAKRYPHISVFGGRIDDQFIDPPDWLQAVADGIVVFGRSNMGERDRLYTGLERPPGAHMMIRRHVLQQTGIRYDTTLGPAGARRIEGEDRAFLYALRRAGYEMMYLADARIRHRTYPDQSTIRQLRRRCFGQGRGYARFDACAARCLFGVPRWVVRRIGENVAGCITAAPDRVKRYRRQLCLWRDLGFAWERFRMWRQGAQAKPVPVAD